MAEVIGLIASILSIATGVLEGVRVVKTCYHASNELETLQASENPGRQLSSFHQTE